MILCGHSTTPCLVTANRSGISTASIAKLNRASRASLEPGKRSKWVPAAAALEPHCPPNNCPIETATTGSALRGMTITLIHRTMTAGGNATTTGLRPNIKVETLMGGITEIGDLTTTDDQRAHMMVGGALPEVTTRTGGTLTMLAPIGMAQVTEGMWPQLPSSSSPTMSKIQGGDKAALPSARKTLCGN